MEDRRSLPPYEDELSLALLRSADQDEPPAAAYSKVATALGVSAAVGLGASLPAQATLMSNWLSGSVAVRWAGSGFAKVALVSISSVLLVGGVALLRHRLHSAANTQLVALSRVAAPTSNAPAAAKALANAVASPTPPRSLSNVPVPVPAPAPSSRGLTSNARSAPATAAITESRRPRVSSLPEQVLSLDRARVALNSGDAGAALTEIAHYRSTWPRGVFLTEASVLEIEALAKRGEIVLAGMRAQAFVTAHPDSPQVERLRALIPHAAR